MNEGTEKGHERRREQGTNKSIIKIHIRNRFSK